jgi:biopolymer transport protein ExbD
MIDVMFFLLVTFMLASLALQNLHSLPVNLPQGKARPMQARSPITLTITKDGTILLDSTSVNLDNLSGILKSMLKSPNDHIIVAADSKASHGIVAQAMIRARNAGVEHFIIAVKYNE